MKGKFILVLVFLFVGNILSAAGQCVESGNYDTITSEGGFMATGCCALAPECDNSCSCMVNGVKYENSCWGCPPSQGGNNLDGYVGKCVPSVWVSTGSITNYFCPGTGCIQPCNPDSAAGCLISCSTINTTYWGNLKNGSEIDQLNAGGTALMVAGGIRLDNSSVNYTIDEKKIGNWLNLWNFFGLRSWNSLVEIDNGKGVEVFITSNSTSVEAYKFRLKLNTSSIENTSDELLMISGFMNKKPVANITYPTKSTTSSNFLNFSVDQLITFNQYSYDEDDLLNLTWDFNDGNTTQIQNYSLILTPNKGNINYAYLKGGRFYTTTLTAKEKVRTQQDTDSVTFYVFGKGINIVPIISSPEYDSLAGYQVTYNASLSYVVNCSDNMPIFNFSVGIGTSKLNCTYLLAPKAIDPVKGTVRIRWKEVDSNNNLIRWMRGDDTDGVIWNSTNYGIIGTNNPNLNGAVVFPYSYTERQFRRVRMEMSYDP